MFYQAPTHPVGGGLILSTFYKNLELVLPSGTQMEMKGKNESKGKEDEDHRVE